MGDFGVIWNEYYIKSENYWLKWLEDRPFTTLFIPGNHDCYPRLREHPLEDWHGGKVRHICNSVIMLERGYIYDIASYLCFCMGGATSVDRAFRKEGRDWWSEEIPSKEEYELAAANLEKHNYQVDYIFTHTGPNSTIDKLSHYYMEHDELTTFLENYVKRFVAFKFWYIGHFHEDRTIDDKYWFLYRDIIEIEG